MTPIEEKLRDLLEEYYVAVSRKERLLLLKSALQPGDAKITAMRGVHTASEQSFGDVEKAREAVVEFVVGQFGGHA